MPGHVQRRQLIADLLVGQAAGAAFGILGREHHRKQVAAVPASLAVLVDHAIEHAVDQGHRVVEALDRAPPQLFHQPGKRQLLHQEIRVHGRRDCPAQLVGFRLDIAVEQRLGDDHLGELRHFLMHAYRLPFVPVVPAATAEIGHDFAIMSNAFPVKSGLEHPPLPEVERTVADQQPIADHLPGGAVLLGEVARMSDQHLLDQVGMTDQDQMKLPQPCVNDVAVIAGQVEEQTQGIAVEGKAKPPGGPVTWAGGKRRQGDRETRRQGDKEIERSFSPLMI